MKIFVFAQKCFLMVTVSDLTSLCVQSQHVLQCERVRVELNSEIFIFSGLLEHQKANSVSSV